MLNLCYSRIRTTRIIRAFKDMQEMPLHTASRASIGKCMSSLQFYHATKNDTLIPWKPTLSEHPKNLKQLLIADRGGIIYEPIIGTYEKSCRAGLYLPLSFNNA